MPRPSPPRSRPPKAERPRFRRAAARATAILDSVDFPRVGPVFWSDPDQAFVVKYAVILDDPRIVSPVRTKFLGAGPIAAAEGARRERAKILAPARRARAAEGFKHFLEVFGIVAPVVGSIVSAVPFPKP